jgi:RHS repeat-associated protein
MSQVNDNWDQVDEFGDPVPPVWDGPDAHRRTFIQDAFGNVIAVRDNTLERTTVRISYSPTGEPILDSEYSGADFDRNGGVDAGDLAAFLAAFQEGDETADMDQNGGVDGGDLDLFLQWHEAGFAGDHTLDAQRFLYRGYHWDDTLKMYHVRHRVYDPARMLWIQRDPLGRIPGVNEYAYCLGEPVDSYDPYGLWDWDNDWVETAVSLFLPTKQGDAAREGFVQGAKDGATMAADNLTYGLNDDLHQAAEQIREENAGDWTYEIGDGASVVAREAAVTAMTMGAGQALAASRAGVAVTQFIARSPTAMTALRMFGTGAKIYAAGQSGYNVGNGIYNISIGNYKQGTVQIGTGGIGLAISFYPNAPKASGNNCASGPQYKTWNQFQAGTKGQFKSRADAGMAWRAYKQAHGIQTGTARSIAQRTKFLKNLADDYRTPSWMKQWLNKGKLPPGYEVDHVVPLSVGGDDIPANMRLQGIDLHKTHHKYYRPWEGP